MVARDSYVAHYFRSKPGYTVLNMIVFDSSMMLLL